MATKEEARLSAETRFQKAKQKAAAESAAMEGYRAAAAEVTARTARLREMRLAKEADDRAAAPVKAPKRSRKVAAG